MEADPMQEDSFNLYCNRNLIREDGYDKKDGRWVQ